MSDWHGWGRRGSEHGALHVGYLPGRKSVCLYTHVGTVIDVHAYFRSVEHAEQVLAWLDNYSGEDVPLVEAWKVHRDAKERNLDAC